MLFPPVAARPEAKKEQPKHAVAGAFPLLFALTEMPVKPNRFHERAGSPHFFYCYFMPWSRKKQAVKRPNFGANLCANSPKPARAIC